MAEHRVPYRDIPWGVAFAVLPGKIIGTFILKPASFIYSLYKQIPRDIKIMIASIAVGTGILMSIVTICIQHGWIK